MKPPPTAEEPLTSFLTEMLLPELRHEVLQFLSVKDLAELSCVSHQFAKDCHDTAFPQYRTAVIRCPAPASNSNGNLSMTMGCYHSLHPLAGALLKIPTEHNRYSSSFPVFEERFTRLQVDGACHLPKINAREAKPVAKSLQMEHVTHMDLSAASSRQSTSHYLPPPIAPSIGRLLTQVVPNLEELDLSNNNVSTAVLTDAARHCPKLNRIRVVNGVCGGGASITGVDWKNCHAMTELILDNTLLQASNKEATDMFQDDDKPEACPLRYCLQNLERVSLKGCRHYDRIPKHATVVEDVSSQPFAQLGLIKFVRNAPKLQWFRSDLTEDNIRMLQEERPEIAFVA